MKIVFLHILAVLLLLAAGCSKKRADEMPRAKLQLTLEILRSMDDGKHADAIAKLDRLSALDPTNSLLHKLQQIEKQNIAIEKVNEFIERGDLDSAEKELQKITYTASSVILMRLALDEVRRAKTLMQLSEKINSSATADELEKNIIEFKKLLRKNEKTLLKIADARMKFAAVMRQRENKIIIFGLETDFQAAANNNNSIDASLIKAQMMIEKR